MKDSNTDGARIRALYQQMQLGQRQAARLLGENEDYFRKVCRGGKPVPQGLLERLERLAERLQR